MFYVMVCDSRTPKRFRRAIKKIWDIITNVATKVYYNFDDDLTNLVAELVKSAVKANIPVEVYQFYLHQSPSSEVNYRNTAFNLITMYNILISFLRNKKFILNAWKFKECFWLKQASDFYHKLVTKKFTRIFWWYSKVNKQGWSVHWIFLDVFFFTFN